MTAIPKKTRTLTYVIPEGGFYVRETQVLTGHLSTKLYMGPSPRTSRHHYLLLPRRLWSSLAFVHKITKIPGLSSFVVMERNAFLVGAQVVCNPLKFLRQGWDKLREMRATETTWEMIAAQGQSRPSTILFFRIGAFQKTKKASRE